ncbi:sensor histidine kinase [Calderihabitans maritimus]|uniref:histidine kinase n=1 Tax=Calderihabitans maritimus TaxID=1246530 RepID=A0A1Z5HR46_9FIRM|nr:ATP-binding protein [Calderihabitans maritimus]GAW92012.1 sensor histidine kinase [Calderihabitans maritimus]
MINSKIFSWRGRLKFRVLAFSLIMSIIPLLILGLLNISAARLNLESAIQSREMATARKIAREIEGQMQKIEEKLMLTANSFHVQLLTADYRERERLLYTILKDTSSLEEVKLWDNSGKELARVSRREVIIQEDLGNVEKTPEFRTVIQDRPYHGPVELGEDGRPMITIAVPVRDLSGTRVVGGLAARVSLRNVMDAVLQIPTGNAGYVLVVDQTGRLIGHTDFSEVLRNRSVLSSLCVQELLSGTDPAKLPVPHRYRTYTGLEVLGVYAPVNSLGWGVVIEEPVHQVFTPIRQMALKLGLATLVVALLVTIISVSSALRFTRPIEILEEGVKRVGAGDLDYVIDFKSEDEVGRLVAAFNQMTRELKQKREMEAMVVQADKLAAVGLLASGVAHEINNPLASVAAYSQDLLERLETEKAEELLESGELIHYLTVIKEQVARAKKITQNLLNFARQSEWQPQELSVNSVIEDALALLEYQFKQADIVIEKKLEPQLPPVLADRLQLQQVFVNLFQNALDAMDKSGRLTISTSLEENYIKVTVSDTGCGIPEEQLPKIFDPFFTTKPAGVGTGLGLSICYGIISRLKGRIKVTSQTGKGTTVTVCLPVSRGKEGLNETAS